MDPTSRTLPSWAWIAAAAVLVAVPIVVSVAIPALPTVTKPAVPKHSAPFQALAPSDGNAAVGTAPLVTPHGPLADAPSTARTPVPADVALPQLEMEMASLRAEKAAIEVESGKLAKKREELETFEKDHPDGVAPELYSRYEDARKAYNSDVLAFKSRASLYQMKVADLERRVDSLQAASGTPATP